VLRVAGAGITGDDIVVTDHFDAISPDVSVVIPLFNHADFVVGAIDSALRSRAVLVEIVVVDDGSTDDSAAVVAEAIRTRPWARIKLVRHPENRGLAAARNSGFEHSTCEAVFLLDADNEVYADGIARLCRALNGSGADFAYGILACFGDEQKLLSHYPWNLAQLCRQNYIDAMALVRKGLWARIGGYSSGPNDIAYGWEDYQFWLGAAAAAAAPAFVPELIGRYRVRHGSMISITGIETGSVEEYLRRTFPTLPWPREVPVDEEVIA
jgi:glycosyltransferase involved in cell wall biosynthesis